MDQTYLYWRANTELQAYDAVPVHMAKEREI